jgi:multicomponent K+:H+ antiporter subunit E
LRATTVRVHRPGVALRFILRVACDVVLSNFAVAWGLIAWRWRRPDARFVTVPLDLRDPLGLAVLAMVTTIVPGTVWSELALDRTALLLHGWDVGEEAAFVARFKARYERPLMEIFE